MSCRKSIGWMKPLNLRKNVEISGPAVSVSGSSLSMLGESLILRVRNNFCSWAIKRDNFFLNWVAQTWSPFSL